MHTRRQRRCYSSDNAQLYFGAIKAQSSTILSAQSLETRTFWATYVRLKFAVKINV